MMELRSLSRYEVIVAREDKIPGSEKDPVDKLKLSWCCPGISRDRINERIIKLAFRESERRGTKKDFPIPINNRPLAYSWSRHKNV